jgi:hypothetical protein
MVVVRTRRCLLCERERLHPDEIGRSRAVCRPCAERNRRQATVAWQSRHRERATATNARWQQTHPDVVRASKRAYHARLRADPQRWARTLEDQRLAYRLRRERQGFAPKPVSPERYGSPSKWWTLDSEPLAAVLRDVLAEEDTRSLALRAGVDDSLVAKLVRSRERVSVDVADRLLLACGLHLDLVYDDVPTRGGRSPVRASA